MAHHTTELSLSFQTDPEAAFAAYQQLGYHIEPDLFSSKQCDELIAASRSLPSYVDSTLVPVMNPHKLEPVFLSALRHPPLVGIMERILGGPVSGLQTQFFFCRPGTPGFTKHQDNFYVRSKPDTFASAWIALEDVSAANGGLTIYPGSHREPILPTEVVEQPDNIGQDPNANRQQVILPPFYAAVDICLPKGAVVLIHGHVVHQSHQNSTRDRFRHALLMLYLRQGEPFRPGFSAGRAEIEVYG
jgi:ectoine hydroxylase-related dioxygenase (phytanoyl-CoA dioxygenase family)